MMGNSLTAEKVDDDDEKKQVNDDHEYPINMKQANPPKEKCNNKDIASLFDYQCNYHLNKNGSITFYPSPHLSKKGDICTKTLKTKKFLDSQRFKDIKKKIELKELEAIYDFDAQIVQDFSTNICPFITGAIKAFNEHYPFKISPNNILLLVLQAIAVHVDKNAEKLRNKYVTHNEKKKLTVFRDSRDFPLRVQCRTNDWNAVIKEFVDQIDKNTVSDTVKLMEADFSDSTIIHKISNKICVMDICKNYFEYEMICVPGCGFPKMTLSGTKDDWMKLRSKVDTLLTKKVSKKWGETWKQSLLPLLDKFIDAYNGDIDCLFWNSMIKSGVTVTDLDSSGGAMYMTEYWFSGWFNILFPYICTDDGEFRDNRYCFVPYSMKESYVRGGVKNAGTNGNDIKVYPIGLSSAPVKTKYIDAATLKEYNYNMKFVSGIIGYKQCPKTFEIQPETGWIITYDE